MATVLIKSPTIDPRYTSFELAIRGSRIHRRGVYAEERIPARRKVIEYTGEKISRRETKRRGDGAVTYLFTLDDYWTLDGAFGGSGAEIINHSCDANLRAWVFKGHILYMSKRVIEPGEELTVDYRFAKDVETVPCRCGAKTCRGIINLSQLGLSQLGLAQLGLARVLIDWGITHIELAQKRGCPGGHARRRFEG